MKIATNSWSKSMKIILKNCYGVMLIIGVVITFPFWVISLGHINISGKLNKMADDLAVEITKEIAK